MEKQNLSALFNGKIFRILDYQRGYVWEDEQWNKLIEDIDNLVTDERVKYHYIGTVVTFLQKNSPELTYNRKLVKKFDVLDRQQKLTSICL